MEPFTEALNLSDRIKGIIKLSLDVNTFPVMLVQDENVVKLLVRTREDTVQVLVSGVAFEVDRKIRGPWILRMTSISELALARLLPVERRTPDSLAFLKQDFDSLAFLAFGALTMTLTKNGIPVGLETVTTEAD